MEKLVNQDYIGVVKEIAGKYTYDMVEIKSTPEILKELKDMVDNKNRTVLDMQSHFQIAYPSGVRLNHFRYCLPWSYNQSYITNIEFPQTLDAKEYFAEIEECKLNTAKNYQKEIQIRIDKGEKVTPNVEDEQDKVLRAVRKKINDDKNEELKHCVRYVNASNFHSTLNLISNNPNMKMHSSEIIGHNNKSYEINSDLLVTLKTNFGYGLASYFFVNLQYKGIDLLPYSHCVKYYRANMLEFIRYTRQYNPERSRWDHALKFVVDSANFALENPAKFEREWVYNEVQEMLSGLERIAKDPQVEINKHVNTKGNDSYITVCNMNSIEKRRYKAYPSEVAIAFKAEKITGALHLLNSLKKLESLRDDIDSVIDTIKELNRNIRPAIETSIASILNDIARLKVKLDEIKLRQDEIIEKINDYNKKVEETKHSFNYMKSDKMTIKPESLIEQRRKIDAEYNEMLEKITDRESFVTTLNSCIDTLNNAGII